MDAEPLLEHAGFLRALSRSLLNDPHLAEDNVQQTYLTALEHPPRHNRNLRAWLGVLARNLALRTRRTAVRRARRERRAANGERNPPVDEIAARVELQRRAAEAVLSLDEPYRSTIVQRYFDGLSPSQIASDRGIPVATVKTRLRRALDQLRRRLDERYGGNRRAWSALLLPAALHLRFVAAAALLCVFAGGTAFVVLRGAEGAGAPKPRTGPARLAALPLERPDAPETGPGPAGPSASGPPRPALAEPAPRPTRTAPVPPDMVVGRVRLDGGGLPIGCLVFLRQLVYGQDGGELWNEYALELGADGVFQFPGHAPGRYELEARLPGFAPRAFRFDLERAKGAGPFEILLRRGGSLGVEVRGPWGAPLPGESLLLFDARGVPVGEEITDGDGRARFRHLAVGEYEVRMGSLRSGVTVRPDEEAEVFLEAACGLTGVVLDPDGLPVARGIVLLETLEGERRVVAPTDEYGFYEMRGFPEGEYEVLVQVLGTERYQARLGRVRLTAGQLADCPLRIAATRLSGRVTCPRPFDPRRVRVIARSADGRAVAAWADPLGAFTFVGLLAGVYDFEVETGDPALRAAGRRVDFSRGGRAEGIDFVLRPRRTGRIRVEVFEPDGTPATAPVFFVDGRRLRARQVGDGLYEITLEVGEHSIEVGREGFAAEPLEVQVREDEAIERVVRLRAREEKGS